jgi:hypothetical protein
MNAGIAGLAGPSAYVPRSNARDSLRFHDVVLHHLRTPAEIEGIIDLRDEIDLSIHAAAGRQQFEGLEKKETSAVSCSGSNSAASGSGRSASSPWATN